MAAARSLHRGSRLAASSPCMAWTTIIAGDPLLSSFLFFLLSSKHSSMSRGQLVADKAKAQSTAPCLEADWWQTRPRCKSMMRITWIMEVAKRACLDTILLVGVQQGKPAKKMNLYFHVVVRGVFDLVARSCFGGLQWHQDEELLWRPMSMCNRRIHDDELLHYPGVESRRGHAGRRCVALTTGVDDAGLRLLAWPCGSSEVADV